jgi:hypothetical protein
MLSGSMPLVGGIEKERDEGNTKSDQSVHESEGSRLAGIAVSKLFSTGEAKCRSTSAEIFIGTVSCFSAN